MKKKTHAKLKKELWRVFSAFIRKRDRGVCFICGRKSEGSGYHAGHFVPKSVGGMALYFNEKNVHGCCYHCNINLGGNLYEYSLRLGKDTIKEIYALKNKIEKWTTEDFEEKIAYYKEKVKELEAGDNAIVNY